MVYKIKVYDDRYETKKGIISLRKPSWMNGHTFEIYCLEGNLFYDVERFDTLNDAENKINELLL